MEKLRTFIMLLAMALTLGTAAQTTKKTTTPAKKTTTTTAKKTTTTAKKTTSAASTLKKTGTALVNGKKTTSTAKKTTTATSTTSDDAYKEGYEAGLRAAQKNNSSSSTSSASSTSSTRSSSTSSASSSSSSRSSSKSSKKSTSSSKNKGWNEAYGDFGLTFVHYGSSETYNGKKGYEESYSGVAFQNNYGYKHAFSLSSRIPLYLRVGGAISYEVGAKNIYPDEKDDDWYSEVSATLFSLRTSVDVGYKLPMGKMSIMPYAGLDLKLNLGGIFTITDHYNDHGEEIDVWGPHSLFDKDKWDDDKAPYRAQFGGHFGADLFLNKHFALGLAFNLLTPFHSISDEEEEHSGDIYKWKASMTTHSLTLKAAFVW